MLMAFPGEYSPLRELDRPNHDQHPNAELSRFSVSHDQIGRLLAAKWLLPEPLEIAIGFHHSPNLAPSHRHYAAIIEAADMLALLSCRSDISGGPEAAKIFAEYLPEPPLPFPGPWHSWQEKAVDRWYTSLLRQREQDHEVLTIFTES
jgi:HD-like signal output (HDOD) protein